MQRPVAPSNFTSFSGLWKCFVLEAAYEFKLVDLVCVGRAEGGIERRPSIMSTSLDCCGKL